MANRQVVSSGRTSRHSFASVALPAAAANFRPTLGAPIVTMSERISKDDELINKFDGPQSKKLVAGLSMVQNIVAGDGRQIANVVWSADQVDLAAASAFLQVVGISGTAEGQERMMLSPAFGEILQSKMKVWGPSAFLKATDSFPLEGMANLDYPSRHYQEVWKDVLNMVATDKNAKKDAGGVKYALGDCDWFQTAHQNRMSALSAMHEQEVANQASADVGAFGKEQARSRVARHPLTLSQSEFREFVISSVLDVIEGKKDGKVFEQQVRVLCGMVQRADRMGQLDTLVHTPVAAMWQTMNPTNKASLEALESEGMDRLSAYHSLVVSSHMAKQALVTMSANSPIMRNIVNTIIPTDIAPESTAHYQMTVRAAANTEDQVRYTKPKNTMLAEDVITMEPEECFRTLFPSFAKDFDAAVAANDKKKAANPNAEVAPIDVSQIALGEPLNIKNMKFVTAKVDDKCEPIISNNKVQTMPVSNVDKSLPKFLQESFVEKAFLGALEAGAAGAEEEEATSGAGSRSLL